MRRFLPLFALLALVGCDSGPETATGSKAPDVTLETVSVPSSTANLKNRLGKVVLLDFWATWCGPCREITPILEAIYERHKSDGLEAMAITNEAREIVAINEKKSPHKIPVYLDPESKATKAFGVSGLPTVIVLDRKGYIVFQTTGFNQGTPNELATVIEKALESK